MYIPLKQRTWWFKQPLIKPSNGLISAKPTQCLCLSWRCLNCISALFKKSMLGLTLADLVSCGGPNALRFPPAVCLCPPLFHPTDFSVSSTSSSTSSRTSTSFVASSGALSMPCVSFNRRISARIPEFTYRTYF